MTGRALHANRLRAIRFRGTLAAALTAGVLAVTGCHATAVAAAGHAIARAARTSGSTSGYSSRSSSRSSSYGGHGRLVVIHDPKHVTGTLTRRCHYRDGGKLPDPRCTPGAIDPAVTQADIRRTICVSGYTKKIRPPASQTDRFKYDVAYPAYGTPRHERTELDHLISLELGGSNDAANLWPEYPPSPNPKDKIENALHRAVCSGRVTLTAAQHAIATNWQTAESVLGLK